MTKKEFEEKKKQLILDLEREYLIDSYWVSWTYVNDEELESISVFKILEVKYDEELESIQPSKVSCGGIYKEWDCENKQDNIYIDPYEPISTSIDILYDNEDLKIDSEVFYKIINLIYENTDKTKEQKFKEIIELLENKGFKQHYYMRTNHHYF